MNTSNPCQSLEANGTVEGSADLKRKVHKNAFAMMMSAAKPPVLEGWYISSAKISEQCEDQIIAWVVKDGLFLDEAKKVRNFGLAWQQGGGHDVKTPFRPIPPLM